MSKTSYSKPPISYSEQLELLETRGLKILNHKKAEHLLKNISYYRLSGYWYPLLENKSEHKFKPEATFETAFNIYKFDRELRLLVLGELEKIEISVRANMIYNISQEHGPFWFLNKEIFNSEGGLQKSLESIKKEYSGSDEEFIKAFGSKYSDVYPPSWMILEITSFGTLSILFSNLRPGKTKREISNEYGISNKVFSSWLHSIVYLRNVCAHHARFWNRVMSVSPKMPKSTNLTWLHNQNIPTNKSYYVLSMILYLSQTINPNNTIGQRFALLLKKYPNIDPVAMGFPMDWENEPLWK